VVLTKQPTSTVIVNVTPTLTRTYNADEAFNPDAAFGENLADRHLAPEPIVQGWLTDPMQCSNIMHPAFTEVGLARSTPEPGSSAGVVWSMVVARPRAQPR
jgi:uncharacterized protein YkwD